MIKRQFANMDIYLSPITFGMMRFDPQRLSIEAGLNLLSKLYESGIDTYHTSGEYEFYEYFCHVFTLFKKKTSTKTTHIVKLACPHFEEEKFSLRSLEEKIDQILLDLDIEQIDVVQWLFRQKQNIDEIRIPKFLLQKDEINNAFSNLQKKGKVKAFASFTYSQSFANTVLTETSCSGLVDYLNLVELENSALFNVMNENKQSFVAIRPLCAGKVFDLLANKSNFKEKYGLQTPEDISRFAILFTLLPPMVSSTILSITSEKHLETISQLNSNITNDLNLFNNIIRDLKSHDLC